MISYIAYAADSQIRYEATSGGVGSAIIKYLFDNQIIQTSITFDYDCNSLQYVPRLIYSYDEYRITGSIYHEIRLIQFIKDNLYKIRGGFACFVLPCQTLAIRTILEKKGIRSILIGLTCSSQQNIGATCYLLKRMRIKERDVERIQYRGNGWPSGIQIKLKNKKEIFVPNNNSIWTDIFHSRIFVMPRCLRCHETISNKVDIALADPWIRAFVKNDNIGNTLCFIMTDVGNNIFEKMLYEKIIIAKYFSEIDAVISQNSTIIRKNKYVNRGRKLGIFLYLISNDLYKNIILKYPLAFKLHVKILKPIFER